MPHCGMYFVMGRQTLLHGPFRPAVSTMPVITIRMSKGRTKEQKQILVEEITGTIVRNLNVDPDWVTILIEELDRENIARAGTLLE